MPFSHSFPRLSFIVLASFNTTSRIRGIPMSDLIQLIYASRSNVAASNNPTGVEPEIGRILQQSRRNNKPKEIGGVLCYGDGNFFQCLEGEREVVESLYDRLHEDERHRDVTLLDKRSVEKRQFKLWAMKYLSVDAMVRKELERAGLKKFDPFRFDDDLIKQMLEVLHESTEAQRTPAGDRPDDARPADPDGSGPAIWMVAGASALVLATLVVVAAVML